MKKLLFIIIVVLFTSDPIAGQTRQVELKKGTPFYIPDGVGVSYQTSIHIDFLPEGGWLNHIWKLVNVKIAMEHSYANDLTVQLKCPGNQSITFFDKSTTPGNTLLGEPWACGLSRSSVDGCTVLSTAMGNCYDYFWSPSSTNGHIFDSANLVTPSWYLDASELERKMTGPDLRHPAPGIEYQPLSDWDNLLGCPMNGDWTLIVTDNIGMDNGWICDWSITLDVEKEYLLPKDLKIEDITTHSARLKWTPVADETGWLVEYKISGDQGPYRRMTTSSPNALLLNLLDDRIYELRIHTFWENDTNQFSLDTTFRTLPDPPAIIQTRPVEFKQDSSLFIPDEPYAWQESTLYIDFFPENSKFNSDTDIERIKVAMEHSYLADLYVYLECPNGQNVALLSGNSSLNKSILGEPWACGLNTEIQDTCTDSEVSSLMGNCYDYFWSANSSNGTIAFADNLISPSWYIEVSDSLRTEADSNISHPAPGLDYLPFNSFSNLIGCPMNGNWKIKVFDLRKGDNGWICGWSVTFNASTELLLPGGLVIEDITSQSAKLTWLPQDNEIGWWIEHRISGTGEPFQRLYCTTPDTVLSDLIADTLYELRIRNVWDHFTNLHSFDTVFRTLQVPNSIAIPDLSRMVTLYPNPVQNSLTVKSDILFENIEIMDMQGRILEGKKCRLKEVVWDISSYPSGIYLVRLETGHGIITRKFIKE